MILLFDNQDVKFYIDTKFEIGYLSPVQSYVQWKLENNHWDDYNELYHATRLIETLKAHHDVWFHPHLLVKEDKIAGVLLIVGGKIGRLENNYQIEEEDHSLLLKYFHILEKGNGYGSLWLKSVLIPYYREKGYNQIYVNSSHKDSFPFYGRLGRKIAEYEQESDNQLNIREGCSFLIKTD